MKILFLADNLRGGGKERRLIQLIKGLEKKGGHIMQIIVLEEEFHYNEIYSTSCLVHIYKRKGRFEMDLVRMINKVIAEFRPTIVHSWGTVSMINLIPLKMLRRFPVINSAVANTSYPRKKYNQFIFSAGFFFSDWITSNTKLGLEVYRVKTSKSSVIYNGFDFERIDKLVDSQVVKSKLEISTNSVVMMVGRFTPDKDYRTFILSSNLLLSKYKDLTVVCMGYGETSELEKLVEPQYRNYVKFIPFQEEVESIMNIASVGVLASNASVHGEGISNALMEFMALGKPVVASNYGGNPELVKDGITGYLAQPNSVDALYSCIDKLLSDEELRITFGQAGKQTILDQFNISRMVDEFERHYKRLSRE